MPAIDPSILESQEIVVDTFKSLRKDLMGAFGNVARTVKPDSSPVTEWDVKVEKTLHKAIAAKFPDLGFQGEETGTHGDKKTYWLVDPIDGTSSFIRGLPFSTNMAALVHDDVVVAAVVYDFIHDDMYTAIKGNGAFKNNKPIKVNTTRKPGNLVVYSMNRGQFGLYQEALKALEMRAVLPMGAAGHAYALLAEGKIDGILNVGTGLGLYDNAPGLLLAEEAGAKILLYDDKEGVYRHEMIIGSPTVTDAIERSGLI